MTLANFAAGGPSLSGPILSDDILVNKLFNIILTDGLDVDQI